MRMCKEMVETIHTFIQGHDKKLQQAAESEVYQRMMSLGASAEAFSSDTMKTTNAAFKDPKADRSVYISIYLLIN